MLKRKLFKACLIMSSFLVVAMGSQSTSIIPKLFTDSSLVKKQSDHQFDSSGLCTCIPVMTNNELVNTLKVPLNKNAAPFVTEYIRKNGFFLNKTKPRVNPYFTIIDSIFEQCQLPVELKYLSYIESGLKCHTKSRTGAIGVWAFMPAAAKQYGLKIYGKNDERLDFEKSTAAAALLLTDLYARYGDWLLALAAYNSGPGYVQKAIKKSGSRNYWTLQHFLPLETRMHVKKFIAVHYYFEGHGSLATMSREETEKHIESVNAFVSSQVKIDKEDTLSTMIRN